MFGILALYAWAGPGESTLPEAVREAAVDSRNLPLAERIDRVSESMLGHPYVNDPLGEGRGVDRDPPVRYDAYDCLTFVEEVLALSLGVALNAPIPETRFGVFRM